MQIKKLETSRLLLGIGGNKESEELLSSVIPCEAITFKYSDFTFELGNALITFFK